ncbi:hypothetical protein Nepgr_013717 [Nepenthes gracilis]|uniref:Alpha/beta hydrolase fold-3 domain-containing protein n=1 Tax=Nepenthes gracilis TaxID=150966 RepID=A0AAD3SK92_NEPGR|nr:hypothetical protein Nepgr_013717 [Nepenthes gracilis]
MANSDHTTIAAVPAWDTIMELFEAKAPPSATPTDGVVSSDVTIDPFRSLWFRLYVPVPGAAVAAATTLPVIIYYHGGGFTFWSPDRKPYDDLCRRLARELSAVVVSVNYRLAPQHRCPTQYDDGFEALKFIDRNKIDGFPANADVGKCFLAGDSAGGNLAHHVAVKACEHEFKALKVIGLITIQPFFAAEERSHSELWLKSDLIISSELIDLCLKNFLPDGSDRNHPALNVFGSKSKDITSINNFPATLVALGGLDPLQDLHRRYCEWLKSSGKEVTMVEYPNTPHLFYSFPKIPESSMFISEIKVFMHNLLAK